MDLIQYDSNMDWTPTRPEDLIPAYCSNQLFISPNMAPQYNKDQLFAGVLSGHGFVIEGRKGNLYRFDLDTGVVNEKLVLPEKLDGVNSFGENYNDYAIDESHLFLLGYHENEEKSVLMALDIVSMNITFAKRLSGSASMLSYCAKSEEILLYQDEMAIFYDKASGEKTGVLVIKAVGNAITSLLVSNCGQYIFVGEGGGFPDIRVFSRRSGRVVQSEEVTEYFNREVYVSQLFQHGRYLFSANCDGRASAIDLKNEKSIKYYQHSEIMESGNYPWMRKVFSSKDRLFVEGDSIVKIYDTERTKILDDSTYKGFNAHSQQDSWLTLFKSDETVVAMNMETGEEFELSLPPVAKSEPNSIHYHEEQSSLVLIYAQSITLIDLKAGKVIFNLRTPCYIQSVASVKNAEHQFQEVYILSRNGELLKCIVDGESDRWRSVVKLFPKEMENAYIRRSWMWISAGNLYVLVDGCSQLGSLICRIDLRSGSSVSVFPFEKGIASEVRVNKPCSFAVFQSEQGLTRAFDTKLWCFIEVENQEKEIGKYKIWLTTPSGKIYLHDDTSTLLVFDCLSYTSQTVALPISLDRCETVFADKEGTLLIQLKDKNLLELKMDDPSQPGLKKMRGTALEKILDIYSQADFLVSWHIDRFQFYRLSAMEWLCDLRITESGDFLWIRDNRETNERDKGPWFYTNNFNLLNVCKTKKDKSKRILERKAAERKRYLRARNNPAMTVGRILKPEGTDESLERMSQLESRVESSMRLLEYDL